MHRSRIGLVLIDHPASDWEKALAFWAGVQGVEPTTDEPGDPGSMYRSIGTLGPVHLESQRTGDGTPARIHLDIESDDVDAEVRRVVTLGATVLEAHETYTVLQDPGGLVFCVVPIQTGAAFEEHALTWEQAGDHASSASVGG
ncbi:VOC family protein [Nocardioides sp. MAHUQ-72]|uniref:VOC family protein n=1 Tax=unclassified Nocardioides TaxID=2615069 RepID=UPI003612C726